MTVKNQIWKCNICGNIIEVEHKGADALVCCGQPMVLKKGQTEDSEKGEKHIPVIEGKKVKIGAIDHPMEEKHYIEWIEAVGENEKHCRVFLSPGDKPETEFCLDIKKARAYCNLHGLWEFGY